MSKNNNEGQLKNKEIKPITNVNGLMRILVLQKYLLNIHTYICMDVCLYIYLKIHI